MNSIILFTLSSFVSREHGGLDVIVKVRTPVAMLASFLANQGRDLRPILPAIADDKRNFRDHSLARGSFFLIHDFPPGPEKTGVFALFRISGEIDTGPQPSFALSTPRGAPREGI